MPDGLVPVVAAAAGSTALALVAAAILALVVLVAWGRVHPFLGFILVSAGVALALGMPPEKVADAIRKGIGSALGSLSIVIIAMAVYAPGWVKGRSGSAEVAVAGEPVWLSSPAGTMAAPSGPGMITPGGPTDHEERGGASARW